MAAKVVFWSVSFKKKDQTEHRPHPSTEIWNRSKDLPLFQPGKPWLQQKSRLAKAFGGGRFRGTLQLAKA